MYTTASMDFGGIITQHVPFMFEEIFLGQNKKKQKKILFKKNIY